jgi:signal transduction histidine kinase
MQRLERVMRRTLSFTKPVKLERKDLDGIALLAETVDELRPVFEPSGVTVRIDGEGETVPLSADPQLLGEVLTNLLSNALEALAEGAGHEIVLTARREEDGVVFTVEDDGPGIPGSLRETLFKPFYTTKSKGSGLGLAFCRKVVEEHGGSISAEDGERGGARFVVRIPSPAPETSC